MKYGKVSVSLPPHIYNLAKKKSELTHGDNFSGYIRDLLCKQFTEEELRSEYDESRKPLATGPNMEAERDTICEICHKHIIPNATICLTDIAFPDGNRKWVHEGCCRKE